MEVQLQYSKYSGQFCMILIKSICRKFFNAEGELAFLLGTIYSVNRIPLEVETGYALFSLPDTFKYCLVIMKFNVCCAFVKLCL